MSRVSGNLSGLRSLRARVTALGKSAVSVGVPNGPTEPDGTSTALVAAVNEMGSEDGHVPERSFLRAGVRENQARFRAFNRKTLPMVVRGVMPERMALELLGLEGVDAVRQKMLSGPFVPNSPATIARKGSDKPLFDSANLFQSITHRVEA